MATRYYALCITLSLGFVLAAADCSSDEIYYVGGAGGGGGTSSGTAGGGGIGTASGGGSGTAGGGGMGGCAGETELCANGKDDDCDGYTDDVPSCALQEGEPSALVVRYFINDATTNPQKLADVGPGIKVPLKVDLGGLMGSLGAVEGHKGFLWTASETEARAHESINGKKIELLLDGKNQATIEVVVDIDVIAGEESPISWIGDQSALGKLSLTAVNNTRASFYMNDIEKGRWEVDFLASGRSVMHVVLNAEAQQPENRVRLYVNGSSAASLAVTEPLDGTEVIDLADNDTYVLGNVESAPFRSFQGTLFYAALYATALSDDIVKNNAAVLAANDDGP